MNQNYGQRQAQPSYQNFGPGQQNQINQVRPMNTMQQNMNMNPNQNPRMFQPNQIPNQNLQQQNYRQRAPINQNNQMMGGSAGAHEKVSERCSIV